MTNPTPPIMPSPMQARDAILAGSGEAFTVLDIYLRPRASFGPRNDVAYWSIVVSREWDSYGAFHGSGAVRGTPEGASWSAGNGHYFATVAEAQACVLDAQSGGPWIHFPITAN